MTQRVSDERLAELNTRVRDSMGTIKDLVLDLQDTRQENAQLRLYLKLVLDVAKDLYEGSNNLIGLHATHPKHPEMDTEEARAERGWRVIPPACIATERYDRVVKGENVGCLEGDETDEDRAEFMEAVALVRQIVGEL